MKRTLQAMLLALVAIMMPIGAWAQETTVEAKWGASAESLTHEGTLAEAIKAAVVDYDGGDYTASDVAYIQLQSSVTTTGDHVIHGGTFTLDLNGHTLTSDGYTLCIYYEGTSVTLTDSSEDGAGKVVSTGSGNEAVYLLWGAHVTIEGGSYESESTAVIIQSGCSATISGGTFLGGSEHRVVYNDGTLIISGGTFDGEGIWSSVCAASSSESTTITGGTFAVGSKGTFEYNGGRLDLTGYPTTETEGTTPLIEVSVDNDVANVTVDVTTIALPTGYCFYNSSEQAVTMLVVGDRYTIGEEPDTKYTITFAPDGGSGEMAAGVNYGNNSHILPECTFTAPEGMMFKAWLVGDTEYQPGEAITVTENTTVTAVWTDYVPQIILRLADSYGDGWNGAAITVKKDGEEIGTATIPTGGTATIRYDYDNTGEYTFYWAKGGYDSECSFVIKVEGETVLTASTEDCNGYEDGKLIHTIEMKEAAKLESLTIADGELTEYSCKLTNVGTLTYTRTLPNMEWNALYVPFEIAVTEALLANYEVAYANNMHAYDTDDNGEIDELEMEVIKIKQGTLHANHPYFIRAKSEAARALTLTVEDAVLYATESVTMTCQSFYTTFTLTGIYSAMDADDFAALDGTHYAIATEGGWWRTEGLGAFRVYMTITEREGSPVKVSAEAMARVRIVTRGEENDGETTEIAPMTTDNGQQSTVIYDLAGRRVEQPTKGVYIVNGRKVIF